MAVTAPDGAALQTQQAHEDPAAFLRLLRTKLCDSVAKKNTNTKKK